MVFYPTSRLRQGAPVEAVPTGRLMSARKGGRLQPWAPVEVALAGLVAVHICDDGRQWAKATAIACSTVDAQERRQRPTGMG
ncbi:hypothetical protein GW17_00059168 [Ensete ventricosum]|nr:hypothetical protein GW17_00059168 [Ensete ventricosum]